MLGLAYNAPKYKKIKKLSIESRKSICYTEK